MSSEGARVYVTIGEQTQMREIIVGGSFYAGPPLEAHFGLGKRLRVDSLRILWPSGVEQEFHDVIGDRILTVREPLR